MEGSISQPNKASVNRLKDWGFSLGQQLLDPRAIDYERRVLLVFFDQKYLVIRLVDADDQKINIIFRDV